MTADHVPPRCLLARPYPDNLTTVPACAECNTGFKADDDYTRTVLTLDMRAQLNEAARTNLPSVLKSLQHPASKGLARHLDRVSEASKIVDHAGRSVGTMTQVNRDRVNATGSHILRGLFYVETKTRLCEHALINIECKPGVSPSDPVLQSFAALFQQLDDHVFREFGSAFSYGAASGKGISIWLMLLYDHFAWIATIDTREQRSEGG